MKKPVIALLTGTAVVFAAGCSTTPTAGPQASYDVDRMALVEYVAQKRGVRIIWVNAPTKAMD